MRRETTDLLVGGRVPQNQLAVLSGPEDVPAVGEEDGAKVRRARAKAVEGAAMAVPGITNSEGGGASFGRSELALATSEGFFGRYAGTSHGIGVAVVAGEGTAMERDYDSASARHTGDLESAEAVGRRAGERTVARLDPRKAKSQSVPVVFEPRVSSGLLGHFAGAISGASIAVRSETVPLMFGGVNVGLPNDHTVESSARSRCSRISSTSGESASCRPAIWMSASARG